MVCVLRVCVRAEDVSVEFCVAAAGPGLVSAE